MRSRSEARLLAVTMTALSIAIAALALPAAPAYAQESRQPPIERRTGRANDRPTEAEIGRALAAVKADPNLATERKIRGLRWKDSTQKKTERPAWLEWIGGLFRWLDQSARLLVYGAAAVLVVWLIVFLIRVVGSGERRLPADEEFIAPTHVRDLDIRPEALPHDIGAAARALWDRGEHRAALALLYRGLLSRLAHVHRVPIRDSSTEGDCLALAARHLTRRRGDYAARLVRVWQRAVYGREDVQTATVYGLCDEFAVALDGSGVDPSSPLDSMIRGGAA